MNEIEPHILSKSTYQRGLQCVKSLFLYKNFIHLRDPISQEQKAVFNRGNYVGVYAQKLFPGGIDVSKVISGDDKRKNRNIVMVLKTQELISKGESVLYEAAFQHQGVLVIVDIIVKVNGEWYAYEVKSSTRITQTYLADAYLQYQIVKGTELPLKDFSLVIINNQYVKDGAIDVKQLFTIKSVIAEAKKNSEIIIEHIQRLKRVLADGDIPKTAIGEHCFMPYKCDFMGYCWKKQPDDSIFNLNGVSKMELFELKKAGCNTISEIPDVNNLGSNANFHLNAVKKGRAVIKKEAIAEFVSEIKYPLSFIDFEVFMPAIPIYNNTRPYQNIPFQYSVHYKQNKGIELAHIEFLAEAGTDPRKHFVEHFLKDTAGNGTILVYDALMETSILNGLKKEFPEYEKELSLRISRFKDLMTPFEKRWYYHPSMNNSCSIKSVLHALIPDLSYERLTIKSGSMAMTAYESLQTETDLFKILEIKDDLLKYCALDTLAMVKVFEILEKQTE